MPMPNQMIKSGARITRGIAFKTSMTGSSSSEISRIKRRENTEHDAGDDAEHEAAECGGERRLNMRPDAAFDEQIAQRHPERLRARHIKRIEPALSAGIFPDADQDRECGELAHQREYRMHEFRSCRGPRRVTVTFDFMREVAPELVEQRRVGRMQSRVDQIARTRNRTSYISCEIFARGPCESR